MEKVEEVADEEKKTKRRNFLSLALAAVGGLALASLDQVKNVKATGEPLLIGVDNTTDATTRLIGYVVPGVGLFVSNMATSGEAHGVVGYTNSTEGVGVDGHATAASGRTRGVFGATDSTEGVGVEGMGGTGVHGFSETGCGVIGESLGNGHGVLAKSLTAAAVNAVSSTGPGVYAYSENNHGVMGTSTNRHGVCGDSENDIGVRGYSKFFRGVDGWSDKEHGITGTTANEDNIEGVAGIAGFAKKGKAAGVMGQSPEGSGVSGRSEQYIGVEGHSRDLHGVRGVSETDVGTSGYSPSCAGVLGETETGIGVHALGRSGTALQAEGVSRFSTIGSGIIPQGEKKFAVSVQPGLVTDRSHISVTLTSNPNVSRLAEDAAVSFIERDKPNNRFTINLTRRVGQDTTFTYFIVEPII